LRYSHAVKRLDLALPHFRIDVEAGLVPALRQSSLHRPFDADAADFSGMTGRPPAEAHLFIGDVVRRAVIEAGEKGIGAEVATAAPAFKHVALPPPPEEESFHADHPFLVCLIDDTSGVIPLQGRVADPRR
jgi:serpin B